MPSVASPQPRQLLELPTVAARLATGLFGFGGAVYEPDVGLLGGIPLSGTARYWALWR
jgi:hypothetical protein